MTPRPGAPPDELDRHLFNEGRHRRLWEVLGAHPRPEDGCTSFAVWAPDARGVRVTGDFTAWTRGVALEAQHSTGIWWGEVQGAGVGDHYKFEVDGADGVTRMKADPLATWAEAPPGTASRIWRSTYEWGDDDWEREGRRTARHGRFSVYEVHLGSWRRGPDGRRLSYREVAAPLADHVTDLGFTHVELLPVAAHPFTGSWGYQVTGYYAPSALQGTPDDLRHLIDHLHQRGIGVIVDWVPAHFPRDEWALARFDGTALYEHADPRRGEHPDWGTYVFNHGRHEVRNFLVANALYWLEEFHLDGLRVDAVASMLYLDYSREEGQWVPNAYGGREDLEALGFLRELSTALFEEHPDALLVAEESTAWPGVTAPVEHGGLGFTHKWNMGWMHDTLEDLHRDPVHRSWHHDELTFGLIYAWSERFVLPLSHDEVVHGKGSLLSKMPGDRWQQLANLRSLLSWMWAHPGGQLLFMGAELGQWREWSEDHELDWALWEFEDHRGLGTLLRDLNRLEVEHPALWAADHDPSGFSWLDPDDRSSSVFSFRRIDPASGQQVVVVANFTPVPRHGYRVGLPWPGAWREVLSSDDTRYGGAGIGNPHLVVDDVPWQHQPASAVVTIPPLGVVYLAPA